MSARYTGGLVYNPPGGWSGLFASGNYISAASNAAFALGTGDFTVEAWVYPNSAYTTYNYVFGVAVTNGLVFYVTGGNLVVRAYNTGDILSSSTIPPLNTWTHVAATRSGTTLRIFVNGVQTATTTNSTNFAQGGAYVGNDSTNAAPWYGYISNFRLVKGTAVYTANFTPPTGALLPITNTSLLTCAYPTFRDGSTNNFTITQTGSVAVSTSNPFPTSVLPNPALGGAGNGIYTLSQYASLLGAGTWPAYDPYYKNVTMMLHGDGTNAAQNNTFLDSSTNNFTITRNGNTTQGTFTPYGSNWSNAFATSAAIRYPYTSSLTSWWTQNFTIEMWIFNNTNAVSGTNSLPLQFAHGVYNSTPTYWSFGTNASGQLNFYYYNGSANNVTSTTTASLGTWNHIAMVYTHSSGNISLYLNGVSVASATKSGTPQNDATNTVNIGAVQSTYYNGYISNLRVLNGTALYSSTFTPSTTPLTAITNTQLLTCQSNRFVDNSTNNATPTLIGSPSVQRFSPFSPSTAYSTSVIGGSGYFDGSGDYLAVANSSSFAFGTGDFTVEFWLYANSSSSTHGLVAASSTGSGYWASLVFSNTLYWQSVNGFTNLLSVSYSGYYDQWTYIAFVRNGGTTKLYLNGVEKTSASDSTNYSGTAGNIDVGRDQDNSALLTGYMSGLRIVKGTAVYTAAFTPPTSPPTAITNTSLLLNYTNAGILDNAMMNDLETVGNAQISTSVKKYGTGSMYFDGAGDYLYAKNNDVFNFGTGDFTVEFWINASASGSYTQVIGTLVSGTEAGTWRIGNRFNSQNQVYFSRGTGSGFNEFQATVNVNDGAWHHVAVTRLNGTVYIYIDGAQIASSAISGTCSSSNPLYVGYNGRDNAYITGYLDDIRITKGVARYTANFTPPTSQVQDQ